MGEHWLKKNVIYKITKSLAPNLRQILQEDLIPASHATLHFLTLRTNFLISKILLIVMNEYDSLKI